MDPPVQVAMVGDNVTFDCTVSGTHPFTVMWTSDITVLESEPSIDSDSSTSDQDGDMITLTLSLSNVTVGDFQTYICSARSDATNVTFAKMGALLSKSTKPLLS